MKIQPLILLFTFTGIFTRAQTIPPSQDPSPLDHTMMKEVDSIQASGIDTVVAYFFSKGGLGFDLQNIKENELEYGRAVIFLFDSGTVKCLKLFVHPNDIVISGKQNLTFDSSIKKLQYCIRSFSSDAFLPYITGFQKNSIRYYVEIKEGFHSDQAALYFKTRGIGDFRKFSLNCLELSTRNIPDFGKNLNFEYNISSNMFQIYSILNSFLYDGDFDFIYRKK
jgi:hypothetical protein